MVSGDVSLRRMLFAFYSAFRCAFRCCFGGCPRFGFDRALFHGAAAFPRARFCLYGHESFLRFPGLRQ
jgi:hypothetical protein